MADVPTYTATPCDPPSSGQTYEVLKSQAAPIPFSNLAAVQVSDDPQTYICCTIDRGTTNMTPEENVKPCQNSGYSLSQCEACNDHWS